MTEYAEMVKRVRAGRMAGQTMNQIAASLGLTYGQVSGIVQRYNVGLPEEARAAMEQARRGKCQEMGRARKTEILGYAFKVGVITRPSPLGEDDYVFDIESRGDAWDEVGEAYLSQDDSY